MLFLVLPKFKFKWVEYKKEKDKYRQMLLSAMLEQSNGEKKLHQKPKKIYKDQTARKAIHFV